MKQPLYTNTPLTDILQRRFQMRYLPPTERLENQDGSKLILSAIAIICSILFALLIWASFTRIEEIAVSVGEIVPQGQIQVIQHLEGGMISEIFVKDGDEVNSKQLLVKLDPTAALAELQEMQSKSAGLKDGSTTVTPIRSQIKTLQDAAMTFSGQLDILNKKLDLQKKELAMYTKLIQSGAVSMRDYLIEQRNVNQTEGEINQTKVEYFQTENLIQKLTDRVNRLTVRSPIHALVQGLKAHPGSVIPPGGIIMELVPLDQELVVESKITTADIGHVKVGDPVKVKIHTYDYTRYGAVTGKLSTISATTFTDEKNVPYYKGTITLDRNYIGADSTKNLLLPGMTVEADIDTGSKSLMQYLLKPIQMAWTSAFHER